MEEGVVLHNQGRLDLSNHSSMVSETNVCVCVCVCVFQPLSLQSVLVTITVWAVRTLMLVQVSNLVKMKATVQ